MLELCLLYIVSVTSIVWQIGHHFSNASVWFPGLPYRDGARDGAMPGCNLTAEFSVPESTGHSTRMLKSQDHTRNPKPYKHVTSWWFQSLWKIWKSVGLIIPNGKIKNVPNYQPGNVRQDITSWHLRRRPNFHFDLQCVWPKSTSHHETNSRAITGRSWGVSSEGVLLRMKPWTRLKYLIWLIIYIYNYIYIYLLY